MNDIEKTNQKTHWRTMVSLAYLSDLETLKNTLDALKKDLLEYQTTGILEGQAYLHKVKVKQALVERTEKLYELVKIVQETHAVFRK
ncbi:hypothetical protein AAG747_14105 [Rapidithrix thailandica]|uniref:Uncharacterized protein n=1 Tax=Rapidithrix thailandica TaxID=413964 RepID=A0AAW9S5B9_9BACT